jgi:glucan phosphoethanolaminetransferase (alkaline phosphatase superfamily)
MTYNFTNNLLLSMHNVESTSSRNRISLATMLWDLTWAILLSMVIVIISIQEMEEIIR